MNTPTNQPPHRITSENPPQFPCWLWTVGDNFRSGFWLRYVHTRPVAVPYTHWHPDQPTAPTAVPEAREQRPENDHLTTRADADAVRAGLNAPPHAAGETSRTNKHAGIAISHPHFTPVIEEMAKLESELNAAKAEVTHRGEIWGRTVEELQKACECITALRAENAELREGREKMINAHFVERPESQHPTLWRYLQNAFEKKITFHSIGVNRMADGGYHFYIHPQHVSGETEDYLIWPDPFNWEDMVVNKKDSPTPDFEKFKACLKKDIDAARKEAKP